MSTISLDNQIQINQLTISRGVLELCHGVTACIDAGDICHIVGENGTGKTTLLLMLAGILPIQAGEITWQTSLPEAWHTLFIGHRSALDMSLSVQNNLVFLYGINPIFPQKKAVTASVLAESLKQVGLSGYEDDNCASLSSGQKRRVQLARLWLDMLLLASLPIQQAKEVAQSRLWLLDEPFTALDTRLIAKLEELFVQFTTLGGRIIVTSHQTLQVPCQQIDLSEFSGLSENSSECNG